MQSASLAGAGNKRRTAGSPAASEQKKPRLDCLNIDEVRQAEAAAAKAARSEAAEFAQAALAGARSRAGAAQVPAAVTLP